MKKINLYIMGIIYIYLGIMHFTNTNFYLPYMPKFLPWHFELIIASGVAEILLGLGVFFKKFRKISLIGIMMMLTVFLIVHFNMLIPENSLGNPTYLLLIRIVIQFGLIYWAWRNID